MTIKLECSDFDFQWKIKIVGQFSLKWCANCKKLAKKRMELFLCTTLIHNIEYKKHCYTFIFGQIL
jgi:hypothetical protein